jgi:pimeloyl-ACP methyl ester carboxylesterase
VSEPRPCRRNARTCRILALIGKAASGAHFAALHKGSIKALVVVEFVILVRRWVAAKRPPPASLPFRALAYFGPLVAWFRKSTAADCGRHRYSD